MILGIGTDITQISRFERWALYPEAQLLKIYSEQELEASLKTIDANKTSHGSRYIPEKLAARFAAKEAFFKALSQILVTRGQTERTFSFLSIAPLITVTQDLWGVPKISINWEAFKQKTGIYLPDLRINLSLAHEKTHAIAFVIIS
ncbi:MAG: holo-ACP synthase [bacterium]